MTRSQKISKLGQVELQQLRAETGRSKFLVETGEKKVQSVLHRAAHREASVLRGQPPRTSEPLKIELNETYTAVHRRMLTGAPSYGW